MLNPGHPRTLFQPPFKWRPVKSQQNPDWDLLCRAFFDYAHRQVPPAPLFTGQITSGPLALVDRTLNLKGAGAGVELVVRQNFSLRCDVATALTELRDDTRPAGQEIVVPAGQVKYYLVSSFSW